MKKVLFEGAAVALVTPFKADGSIDYECFGKLIDYQVENGTDALVICGTTGESSTMDADEHTECIRFAVEKTAGRVPVIAGTGSNDTAFCISHSKEAKQVGADGLLLVTPYYNKTTQLGLIRHYNAVADQVDLPCILYNVPARTGLNIAPETYLELSKHPNIVAAKEASGNISAAAQTMALVGDALTFYSGNDDQIVPLMSLGAKGVISVASNILPREMHDLCAAYLKGDVETARKMQLYYLPVINALFAEVNPMPVKAAMELLGLCEEQFRLPLCPVTEKTRALLKSELTKIGLLKN